MGKKIKSPLKTIRAYCLACSNGSWHEVKNCPCPKCELYPYRLGHRPGWREGNPDEDGEEAQHNGKVWTSDDDDTPKREPLTPPWLTEEEARAIEEAQKNGTAIE